MSFPAKPPRHSLGDIIGDLTITGVLDHSDWNPDRSKHYAKRQWWYEVQCECEEVEITNQQNLSRKKCCVECERLNRSRSVSRARRKPTVIVPDFARMKLRFAGK